MIKDWKCYGQTDKQTDSCTVCDYPVLPACTCPYFLSAELSVAVRPVQLCLWLTRVWWHIEISKFLAFVSNYIFTLQQFLEDPVEILFHIPNRYPHFWGGSEKCTQGTPPVKARNSQKV